MKLTSIFLACSISCVAIAQDQVPNFFSTNYSQFNPGATGLFHKISASASYMKYAAGLSHWPSAVSAAYQQRFDVLKGGLGVVYNNEEFFYNTDQRVLIQYSYHLALDEERTLGFGGSFGTRMVRVPNLVGFDGVGNEEILYGGKSGPRPTFNAGVMYKGKKLTAGFSSTQLNESTYALRFEDTPVNEGGSYEVRRNYFLNGAYSFDLNDNFQLEPQLLIVSNGIWTSTFANLVASYQNRFWGGFTMNNRSNFGLMLGADLFEKFRIGYHYQATFSRLNNGVSLGTHELALRYALK